MKQISLVDNPDLVGTARFSAKLNPQDIAAKNNLMTERSFDDLDYFEFFGFENDEVRIGIRKHRGNQSEWSYVSVSGFHDHDAKAYLAKVLSISVSDIVMHDDSW